MVGRDREKSRARHGAKQCPVYPIALDLRGRRVVVVGGGNVAERKVRALVQAGAWVTVVAPAIGPALRAGLDAGGLTLVERPFAEADLDGATLAFAATDRDDVNAAVVAAARARRIPVNDTTDAERSDFATALAHRVGSLTFTVDTGGASPSFALRLREELRERFDERYARAAETLGRMRAYATAVLPPELRPQVMSSLAARGIDELASIHPAMLENEVEAAASELAGSGPRPASGVLQLVCATRPSALALWQTRHVMAQLAAAGIASTILPISTRGDRIQDRSLAALGTDSIFVKELELALREHRADCAVHSCKDLPSSLPDDMRIAAIGAREDPRDAFCSERYASFGELPAGSLIGTSSPRRRAQLQALRPDLRFEPIRGNVDTRLRKLREGGYDAIVLALAGLSRLRLRATHTVPLDPALVVPAVGQGALAIECRADDGELAERLHKAFADSPAEIAVRAERAFLRALRGGCQAPVGAHATYVGGLLTLRAAIAAPDGSQVVRGDFRLPLDDPRAGEERAEMLAHTLLVQGGAALLERSVLQPGPLAGVVFLLPRTQERSSRIAPALRGAGAEVIEASQSAEAERMLAGRPPDALLFPSSGSVEALAEYLGRLRNNRPRPIVVAMGDASSEAAREAGFPPDVVAPEPTVAAFVQSVTHYILERFEA
jgi:hydroxymethylbilane synthase